MPKQRERALPDIVGLLVIVSQAVVTTIVLLGYSFLYFEIPFPKKLILFVLIYNVIAIAAHMVYRKRERGVKRERGEEGRVLSKGLLIFHSLTSVLAIFFGFLFIHKEITVIIYSTLAVLWLASFSSGVRLYIKK